jgi:hypothetical protein
VVTQNLNESNIQEFNLIEKRSRVQFISAIHFTSDGFESLNIVDELVYALRNHNFDTLILNK